MPQLPAYSNTQLKTEVIAQIPRLRAFALSLSSNPDRADDLVQETIVKAWRHLGSFAEGSNLGAWLFTILRNSYFSDYRKRRREVQDSDGLGYPSNPDLVEAGTPSATLAPGASVHWHAAILVPDDSHLSRLHLEAGSAHADLGLVGAP